LSGKYLAGGPGTYTRIRGTGTEENPYVWAKQAATAQNNTQQSGGQNISLTGTTWTWGFVENDLNYDLNFFKFINATNFVRETGEWVGEGKYTVSGNKVTFTFNGQTRSFTGTISGNVLTIEGERGAFYKTATNNSGQSSQNISLAGTTWVTETEIITFNASPNMTYLAGGYMSKGTYTVSGNKVTMTIPGLKTATGTISGNVLTVDGYQYTKQ
jgi:formylmethanofuran dehydrogenase subunit C